MSINFLFTTLLQLMLVTGNLMATDTKVNLAYTLEIKQDTMHVTLDYTPLVKDSTTFEYGNLFYGGMKDLINSIKNIRSQVTFKIDSVRSAVTFYHPSDKTLRIRYDIVDTHKPEQRVVGEMFRPILTSDYFFSLSHTLFLNPLIRESRKDSVLMSVSLKPEPAFPMYFTFAPELRPGESVTLKLSDGMDALVTGASDLHIEKRESAGIMNYIVLRINSRNSYNLGRFMNYFDRFLPAMTDFWGSLNGSYYSLVASSFLDIKYHKISGTAFKGGFHVKFSGDTILADDEVVYTISHEIMHRYIGTGCVSMGEDNQWFDEGFTDYTTWYLLSGCGIMPHDKLREMVRDTYTKLSVNPVKNSPNEEIKKHFWDGKNYEKLPYCRGALFASYIDRKIMKASGDSCAYRDLMRSLKSMAEKKNGLLTIDDFIKTASKYIPNDELESDIRKYILQGEMIPEEKLFD